MKRKKSKLKSKFQKGKLFGGIAIFVAVFAIATIIKAAATDSVSGWLWGGGTEIDGAAPWNGLNTNIGWISMNNTNPEIVPPGGISYGVNIPAGNGDLSGYAWSENIGYIAFDNSAGYLNGCPSGICSARRVGNNLEGWARFVEIKKAFDIGNSGGWQGWIKLNPNTGGVSINTATRQLQGSAWSDELGWVDFSRAAVKVCGDGFVDAGEQCDAGAGNGACPSACSATCTFNPPCPVNGACGPANGNTYVDIAAVVAAGQCSIGSSSDPTAWSWTCSGLNGGSPSGLCTASQAENSTFSGTYKEVAP